MNKEFKSSSLQMKCKSLQLDLNDVFYNEKPMTKEIEVHLNNCQECNSHWKALHDIKQSFSESETDMPVDIQVIRQAFKAADKLKEKHKSRIEFAIFLSLITVLMFIVVCIAAIGYGAAVLIVQMSLVVLIPLLFSFRFIFKSRRAGA